MWVRVECSIENVMKYEKCIRIKEGMALKLNYLFIYFWLCWVFVAGRLSLVAGSGGYPLFWFLDFSLWWLLIAEPRLSAGGSVMGASVIAACGL